MLEEVLSAVNAARITYLIKQLSECHPGWQPHAPAAPVPRSPKKLSDVLSNDVVHAAVIGPAKDRPAGIAVGYGRFDEAVVTYHSPHEHRTVTYVIRSPDYQVRHEYRVPRRGVFYVHVPPWARIRSATSDEMGMHVLGTANLATGEIRLLEGLDPVERTEVLLHETMHLLYPLSAEGDIRSLVRTVMGKENCVFH